MNIKVKGETFSAHAPVLLSSSLFFKKALSGKWEESNTDSVKLPEVEPDIFTIYLHWLYFGTLPVLHNASGSGSDRGNEDLEIAKAYVLGDRLIDTKFQNAVIDAIIEKNSSNLLNRNNWCPSGKVIEYIYNNTHESAKIRKLFIDLYMQRCQGSWLQDSPHRTKLPQPFLLELVTRLIDRPSRLSDEVIKASNYYVENHPVHRDDDGK